MKTIKSLLAISVLAAAGTANAAIIATYDVTIDGVLSGVATGTITTQYAAGITTTGTTYAAGTPGTATLDNTGTMIIDYTADYRIGTDVIFDMEIVFQGTITADQYTITSGTLKTLNCLGLPAGYYCSPTVMGLYSELSATPTTQTSGGGFLENPFNIATGGANTSTTLIAGGYVTTKLNFNFTPTVPVPAAAWLFGSGLMGLAGLARRRKAV